MASFHSFSPSHSRTLVDVTPIKTMFALSVSPSLETERAHRSQIPQSTTVAWGHLSVWMTAD